MTIKCSVVNSGKQSDTCIIWLHGLGADGEDFVPVANMLKSRVLNNLTFVFPHAPAMPITINNNFVMPAWYDIKHYDLVVEVDTAGLASSLAIIDELVQQYQEQGFTRFGIAGFSQGGAVAAIASMQNKAFNFAILLSTYLPFMPLAFRSIPIFIAHGTLDPIVPIALGRKLKTTLEQHGALVTWQEYYLAHMVSQEEIEAIDNFLLSTAV